jgi:hypothetical protein
MIHHLLLYQYLHLQLIIQHNKQLVSITLLFKSAAAVLVLKALTLVVVVVEEEPDWHVKFFLT